MSVRCAMHSGLLAWVCAGMALAVTHAQPTRSWPPAMLEDADLHDLDFVDPLNGWAVGDRGVILRTSDGGQTWSLQSSGVACPLWSVDFVDADHGWAVGGETLPYLHRGRGVVLATQDGGATWESEDHPTLPTLLEVRFRDHRHGMALGARSSLFLGGVFATDDGGRVFNGIPTLDSARAADWSTRTALTKMARSGRAPHVTEFQFRALATAAESRWVAGTPGTRVFRTDDDGQTWKSFETGCTTPIRALHFVDRQHGWAAGALGTILVTANGGETWSPVRGAQRRAAALVVCSGPDSIPFSEISALAAVDGYRVHVLVVTHQRESRPFVVDAETRLHEAIGFTGGHGATWWSEFEMPPRDSQPSATSILAAWHQQHVARSLPVTSIDLLTKQLTAAIRTWKPDVVYYASQSPPSTQGDKSIDELIGMALDAAGEASGSAAYFRQLVTAASLPTWKLSGITRLVSDEHGVSVPHRLSIPLGCSTSQLARQAAAKIANHPAALISFQPLSTSDTKVRLTYGLRAGLGTAARREAIELGHGNLEQIAQRAQRERQLESMVDRVTHDKAEIQATQIIGLASDLGPHQAARIVARLATTLESMGHWQLAQESWQLIPQRFPKSPLVAWAWMRQWQHLTSVEIKTRKRAATFRGPITRAVAVRNAPPSISSPRVMTSGDPPTDVLLETIPFALQGDPAIEFVRHRGMAAHRGAQRERIWKRLVRRTSTLERWRRCAEGELALYDPTRSAAKPMVGIPTGARPVLDGVLDDSIWETAGMVMLEGTSTPSVEATPLPCVVRVARDAQHLYCAIQADKLPSIRYEQMDQTRQRDSDLSDHDRVQLFLDVDRDYQTGWSLEVDHRGWAGETFARDRHWNPKWYIATSDSERNWIVELAIPLAELGGELAVRDAWGFAVRRIIPGSTDANRATTSWPATLSADMDWTECGYLRFVE